MKLCADILYGRLKAELKDVLLRGTGSAELLLGRPEFYLDRTQRFEQNHVYVCSADHLPQRPSIGENVCLICLGEYRNLTSYYDRCSVIAVQADTDIFRVFNLVQHIFDHYEAWEERLWHILRHGASLPKMCEASREIFGNPLLLIGSDFRYLAITDEDYLSRTQGIRLDTEAFDAEKLATFLSLHDLSTHVKEPIRLNLMDVHTLSINIFDQDEYLGCLTLFEAFRPLRDSDCALATFLTKLLRQAMLQNPVLAGTRSALRRALRSIIAGLPVDFELRRALAQENGKDSWICVRLQPQAGAVSLPGSYLCSEIEQNHAGAIAFEYEHAVAAFLPEKQLADLTPLPGVVCGVSGTFSNLHEANHAWFQACAALQNGLAKDGDRRVFLFENYILEQLLTSALASRPGWVYYPEGLKRLKAHDENSQVSYLDTLRVYLDNNLSITRTAAALYLHRSTLIDRLAHITRMLGGDLKDPDFCLTLGILLRAELQQKHLTQDKGEK